MWVRKDEYISVSWKPNISPLKSLIEITSEVRESGEWRGEFSAKLDSHLPLVFRLFMFLVYDQEDANLFYQSQRGDKQCGIFALDLKIFFFEVKKSFCSSLKINSSCRDSETNECHLTKFCSRKDIADVLKLFSNLGQEQNRRVFLRHWTRCSPGGGMPLCTWS